MQSLKQQLKTDDSFKSKEESDFSNWLREAQEFGLVEHWQYEPKTFTLAESVKQYPYVGCEYTPDFVIGFDPFLDIKKEFKLIKSKDTLTYIDVKGVFMQNQRDFSVKKAWMFKEFGIYINKVTPKFYTKCFAPQSFLVSTKTGKSLNNKLAQKCVTIEQYLGRNK